MLLQQKVMVLVEGVELKQPPVVIEEHLVKEDLVSQLLTVMPVPVEAVGTAEVDQILMDLVMMTVEAVADLDLY